MSAKQCNDSMPRSPRDHILGVPALYPAALCVVLLLGRSSLAQNMTATTPAAATTEQKVQQLSVAVVQAQAHMDAYQKELQDLQKQLSELRQQLAEERETATPKPSTPSQMSSANSGKSASAASDSIEEIRERQAMQESQIATHEQTKVETESKYPLKVNGLVLFNGYVNTRQVDVSVAPSYALPGDGSTGLSLRQTVLGLDARGPHLFGATSHADVRVDFFANGAQSSYAASGLLRLRTAHAALTWPNTEAFVAQDRSLLSPNAPSSLVAVAQPEFAWSGNLWTWNPQLGASHQLALSDKARLIFEAGLIDTADPPIPGIAAAPSTISGAERSRWPGTEARIAIASGTDDTGAQLGASGYFSPHKTREGEQFDSWAAAMDLRAPINRHLGLTVNAYRGAGLGGLGGGGFVDYVHLYAGGEEVARALDDVGGWAQLQSKVGERLEFNTGYGIDNPFAQEIRTSTAIPEYAIYPGLARNRSAFGNVIYSPSTYLLFSFEYRKLWTNYATGPTNFSDVIGIAAGYRF